MDGADALPEAIITTSTENGSRRVSVYDREFRELRTGELRSGAHLVGTGEVPVPTLSFLYELEEGGRFPDARQVLRLVDLETGTDEVVFRGEVGRGVTNVVRVPGSAEFVFAYTMLDSSERPPPHQLWRASGGSAERIAFEEPFLAAAHESEARTRYGPLADVRPLAVSADGQRLFFAGERLYVLDLTSSEVELAGSCEAPVAAWLSPDGRRLAVRGSDLSQPSAPLRVVVIDIASGDEQEIRLPPPVEEASGGAWHPDGQRFACVGDTRLWRPDPDSPNGQKWDRGLYAYFAVFLVDIDTGQAIKIARDPSTPSEPPPSDEFDLEDSYGHGVVGFSRDGQTLYLLDGRLAPAEAATATTAPAGEGDATRVEPALRVLTRLVAVDVDTNRRGALLPLGENGTAMLTHR